MGKRVELKDECQGCSINRYINTMSQNDERKIYLTHFLEIFDLSILGMSKSEIKICNCRVGVVKLVSRVRYL